VHQELESLLGKAQERESVLYDQNRKLKEKLQAFNAAGDVDPVKVKEKFKEKDDTIQKLRDEIEVCGEHCFWSLLCEFVTVTKRHNSEVG
jgi:hypothetical protein